MVKKSVKSKQSSTKAGPAATKSEVVLDEYQTADKNGKAAPFRFTSAASVRAVFEDMRLADSRAADLRGRIKRAYTGCRPYDPRKMAALGLKQNANVNLMGLKGQIDARAGVVQDMALDTTDLIELRPVGGDRAGPEVVRVGEVVAREFSTTLRGSRRFLSALTSVARESGLYGLGPITWPDYKDFEPVALECGQVKYMENASSVSSENELYMIESPFDAGYLFRLVADKESAEAAAGEGWNIPEVRRLLYDTFVSGKESRFDNADPMGTSPVESAISMWRQSRYYEQEQFKEVRVVNAYAREVSGEQKITHYIVTAGGDGDGFLFRRPDAYDSMDQCMIWLTYTAGDRFAREVRGLATYLLPMEDMNNKLMCRVIDVAMLEAGYKIKGDAAARRRQLSIYEFGAFTAFPKDIDFVQNNAGPDLAKLASTREMMQNTAYNNAVGARGPAAMAERVYSGADRKTKDQVRAEASAGARVEKSMFAMQSVTFDLVFRECFRRMINILRDRSERDRYPAVMDFVDRCSRQDVSMDEILGIPGNYTVYMCRDLVMGGADAKGDAIEGMVSAGAGNFDEVGLGYMIHDLARCRFGKQTADRYKPLVSRDKQPSDAASLAQVENNDMRNLQDVLAASNQLQWAHINVHGKLVQEIIETVANKQFEDPQRMLDVLGKVVEHIRVHLSYGRTQTGMEGRAKEVERGLRSLKPYITMLTLQAQAQQKQKDAQQRQAQIEQERLRKQAEGHEARVKMHKIDTDASLQLRKQDLDQQVKLAGVQSHDEVERIRAEAKIRIEELQAKAKSFIQSGQIIGNRPPDPRAVSGTGAQMQ